MSLKLKNSIIISIIFIICVFYLAFLQDRAVSEEEHKTVHSFHENGEEEDRETSITIAQVSVDDQDPNEFPIKFYYKYYVDLRYDPWRLRLFSMNPCLPENFAIPARIYCKNSPQTLELIGRHTEKKCPYEWDVNCFYNSFFFEANITEIPDKLEIFVSKRRIEFRHSKIVRKEKKKGLTMIVAPVYFYSHIHNIFLFFEAWRAQGATKFLVFYHSGTQETRKILEYYRGLGIVELLPWPGFGELPEYIRNRHPEVDSSVCRSGQTLAQNIAALEADTDLASSVDFDEILVSENMTVEARIRKVFNNLKIAGAAYFPHHYVQFEPNIENFNYRGVLKPMIFDEEKANKMVFNTSVVDNIDVHFMNSFISDETIHGILDNTALLHNRFKYNPNKTQEVELNMKIFPENEIAHLNNMKRDLKNIFQSNPKLNPKINEALEECFKNLEKIKVCRSLVYFCKPAVMKFGVDWDFESTPPSEIFL